MNYSKLGAQETELQLRVQVGPQNTPRNNPRTRLDALRVPGFWSFTLERNHEPRSTERLLHAVLCFGQAR